MKLLNKPIQVGAFTLHNRLVMAPVALDKSDRGQVSQALLDHYAQRTQGGCIGLVVTEHSLIRPDGRDSEGQLSAFDDGDIPSLAALARTIQQNGSRAILQMNHAGGAVMEGVIGTDFISPSGIMNPIGTMRNIAYQPSRPMSQTDIDEIVQCFAAAARRAKQAGFDGCEIHAAHGYLLNQFYSPLTNKRTDAYSGGTLEGRIRMHLEVIAAVRAAVGPDFLLAMRFGGCDYHEGGSTIQDAAQAAPHFERAGLDLLDVSGGMCFFRRPDHRESGYFGELSQAVKNAVSIPVIVAGGVTTGDDAEAILQAGQADMVAVGRYLSKNPDWARNAMA